MRKLIYILIGLQVFIVGCDTEEGWDCLKSFGRETSEVRYPGTFDKVFITDKVDMDYRYANSCYVEVFFGENIISKIETKVEDNALFISNSSTCNWVRSLKVIPLVVVYSPTLSYLENTSSATITMRDTLVSPDFLYEQRGSNGNANLILKTDSARVYAHTGYTGITVSGKTHYAGLYNASVGKLNAGEFTSNITIVNNTSLQDLPCVANSYLFGEINLSGNIIYSGDPEVIDTSIHGTGRVIPK